MANLKLNKILLDLQKVRAKIGRTDRIEQLQELIDREKAVHDALLKQSAKEHDGIKLLVSEAKWRLEDIYSKILSNTLKPEEIIRAFQERDLMLWFLSFFQSSEEIIKDNEQFCLEQLSTDLSTDEES